MAEVLNPRVLSWVNPTQALDQTGKTVAWDPATDLAGVEIQLDGAGAVSVPLAAVADAFDLTTLAAYEELPVGTHTVALAVTTKEGVSSDFSVPVTFLTGVVPLAPTGLTLA